jgi:error-prone DNA polymerase
LIFPLLSNFSFSSSIDVDASLDIKLVIGSQVSIDDESTIILLAQEKAAYANLYRILTVGRLGSEKGRSRVSWQEIYGHSGGLTALWGGDQSLAAGEIEPG